MAYQDSPCFQSSIRRRFVSPWLFLLLFSPSAARSQFLDVTLEAQLDDYFASSGDSHGPGGVFADLDLDGYPDLVLVTGPCRPNFVYHNVMFCPPEGCQNPADERRRKFERMELPMAAEEADRGCYLGSTGAVAGDYDNDGDLDLYVLNHPFSNPTCPASVDETCPDPCTDTCDFGRTPAAPNVLWRNRWIEEGVLEFEDVTAETVPTDGGPNQHGLGYAVWSPGGGPAAVLDSSLTAAWADVDRDGDLDLYVGNHNGVLALMCPFHCEGPGPGQRDVFYRNEGGGMFRDVTDTFGVPGFESATGVSCPPLQLLLACQGLPPVGGAPQEIDPPCMPRQCFSSTNAILFADLNNDGWPDLFVTNKVNNPDEDADTTYLNLGSDGDQWLGFENATYELDIESPEGRFGRVSHQAMGVDAGDYDNDGDLDLYITDLEIADAAMGEEALETETVTLLPPNDLMINQLSCSGSAPCDLTFEVSDKLKGTFSWGTQWLDVDNDGDLDLHVATGSRLDMPVGSPPYLTDILYIQGPAIGDFTDRAAELGVAQAMDSRGDLTADYDQDGDIDLFVINKNLPFATTNAPSVLYENQLEIQAGDHNYLNLKLIGDPDLPKVAGGHTSSRDAIGARACVTAALGGSGSTTQMRDVISGSGNAASTSSLVLEFGLRAAPMADVEVWWPSGRHSRLASVRANQSLKVEESLLFTDGFESGDMVAWAPPPPGPCRKGEPIAP